MASKLKNSKRHKPERSSAVRIERPRSRKLPAGKWVALADLGPGYQDRIGRLLLTDHHIERVLRGTAKVSGVWLEFTAMDGNDAPPRQRQVRVSDVARVEL